MCDSQIKDLLKYLGKTGSHTILKVWEKWILILKEKYEKTPGSFPNNGFLITCAVKQKYMQFPEYEKSGFQYCGKSMGKHKPTPDSGLSVDLELLRTYEISACEGCTNSYTMKTFFGNSYHSQALVFEYIWS